MFRALRPATAVYRNAAAISAAAPRTMYALNFARAFASVGGLARADVEKRVLDVLTGFNKVDSSKITLQANFNSDLHLDSLDTVEVVMAIEEEFSIEIPDKDADDIKSAAQAVDYISRRDDAH